jgi:hypothetical protein
MGGGGHHPPVPKAPWDHLLAPPSGLAPPGFHYARGESQLNLASDRGQSPGLAHSSALLKNAQLQRFGTRTVASILVGFQTGFRLYH